MITYKKKICTECKREEYIFSKGRCKSCSLKGGKKLSKKIRTKENKVDIDSFFVDKLIQLNKSKRSEESGKPIPYPTRANICHIFNKRNHPSVAYHSENYVFLTVDEHSELDNRCLDVNDLQELEKRFPKSFHTIMERAKIVLQSVTERTKFTEIINKYFETEDI